jgi:hypothetical protein
LNDEPIYENVFNINNKMPSNYLKPIKKVLKMPNFEGNNDGYHKSCLNIFTSQLEVTEH